MTPYQKIYDNFFSYVTDDMYLEMTPEETAEDCESLLLASLPLFEFPKEPIELDEVNKCVTRDLTQEELNIIAVNMVQAWLQRQITSVEMIRQKMTGTDFKISSQASHLKRLISVLEQIRIESHRLQTLYSRREMRGGKVVSTFYKLVKKN